ncbi:hypothetical protein [Polaribacter sp. Hel1_85]|uniref:hypothetical protein n=1 Tax=Polaribacter sp. Hel1_85 TaxID=1250005 RepID=UPI00052B8AAB|nr:hypothetical protein [Polaribacter sp. Hel1_85]KGL58746.1 hypothetical protein PHEL85_3015 [Polaribacter sp. Hel1_85]
MKQIIYFLLSVILFSCGNNKKETPKPTQEIPQRSVAKQHVRLINVNSDFEKEIANWQELKSVNTFLKKFNKVSPNEALSNALELRDLVKSLKDSVKPTIFDVPSFEARVNVLQNETLRLADLTLIPAITSEEVNLQVDKTIAAFSSVNSKINTILSKKRFEDAIDIEIDYIGIDSTKMDSVSKKSINLIKKEELLKKKRLPVKSKLFKPKKI